MSCYKNNVGGFLFISQPCLLSRLELSQSILSINQNSFFWQTFNELFDAHKTEGDILAIVSKAEEFEQIKVRTWKKTWGKETFQYFPSAEKNYEFLKVHLELFVNHFVFFQLSIMETKS